jgi:transposase
LQTAKKLRWRFILTGDESWFFYVNEHQKLWLPPDSEAPEVSRRLISTPKVMITLFWNTSGLHVSDFLAGESFNAEYFVRDIMHRIHLLPIVSIAHEQTKRFVLHMDNAPIHHSKVPKAKLSQMPVHLAPHPPYSPDLAPSDFLLFGYLKAKLFGCEFESAEALLDWIREAFESIRPDVLERVFESRITRVEKYIQHEGAYFSEE